MQGKYDEAIKTWAIIINDYSDSYMVPNAYQGQARCYELLNNYEKATEIYTLINNMFSDSPWAGQSKIRLDFFSRNNLSVESRK